VWFTWHKELIDCVHENLEHEDDPLSDWHVILKELVNLANTLILWILVLLDGKHSQESVGDALRIELVRNQGPEVLDPDEEGSISNKDDSTLAVGLKTGGEFHEEVKETNVVDVKLLHEEDED
jgi:hypothetical protein